MKNNGLFSSLFIKSLGDEVELDDVAQGRMTTLAQKWRNHELLEASTLWTSFMKPALSYLQFVPPNKPEAKSVYPLFEDYSYSECIGVLYLIEPGANIDDTSVGRFYPAKLLAQLCKRNLNWGILSNGAVWRLYYTKSSRPYEDYVELLLEDALNENDKVEYGLFERFFHKDSFVLETGDDDLKVSNGKSTRVYRCRLDHDKQKSEEILKDSVKTPLLNQLNEVLRYVCNGFIHNTAKTGEDYTEEERAEIFESSVKFLYRCLFLFYAESHHLLPSEIEKEKNYKENYSIQTLCYEARKFRWNERTDTDKYDLWKYLKGLVNAVNEGDSEYGIMGYNGGLFDDTEERFLGEHELRNDFLSKALYLLAYVEPYENDMDTEYSIPYQDLEVRHLGEIYENILEYTVKLAEVDWILRRDKKNRGGKGLLPANTQRRTGDILIRKGDVYFGGSGLERKQTGSYYTPESLVRFINEKTIVQPLKEKFKQNYRQRFDELLEVAQIGYEPGKRRGAAQSAATIIERFVDQELLNFRICDPAMGSGHFLVDAANQMAGLVIELLEEIPDVESLHISFTSSPNDWRRQVTRHCLYGVDLKPLSVDLAKLSLWLNCFAKDHKLTFIDHHLRQGNSLIGLRALQQLKSIPERKKSVKSKNIKQSLLFDFDDMSQFFQEIAKGVASIVEFEEDDTDAQKAKQVELNHLVSIQYKPLADLFTGYLMDGDVSPDDYREIFQRLVDNKAFTSGQFADLDEKWNRIKEYSHRYEFFHWPLEFPEVFGISAGIGFSATIGNPPWDAVKRNSKEFFSYYDSKFRQHTRQKANTVAKELIEANSQIKQKWKHYCDMYEQLNIYYRQPGVYTTLGSGHINTYQLFLELFFTLIRDCGHMGIVVPSGVYTDKGCMPIRQLFFDEGSIDFIYSFVNLKKIFNISKGIKFVLLGVGKGKNKHTFNCAFKEHDPEILTAIEKYALRMSKARVRQFSPNSLSVMEFHNQEEIDLAESIYSRNPLLGDYLSKVWNSRFQREFNLTEDSNLFITGDQGNRAGLLPLWRGRHIGILTNKLSNPTYWMNRKDIETKATTQQVRVVYRDVSNSSSDRTLNSTVIPAGFPTGNSIYVCPLPTPTAVIIAAIAGSIVLDWVVCRKITMHASIFIVDQLPIADFESGDLRTRKISTSILARACRLICTSEIYSEVWSSCFQEDWVQPEFWYSNAPRLNYGPAHEWEIRKAILEHAQFLEREWNTNSGARDGLSDGVDAGDRAQLRAEIDAYVAHLYGLRREQFSFILDAFLALKKKEEQLSGEFTSRRKCLEEFDRLAPILGEKL